MSPRDGQMRELQLIKVIAGDIVIIETSEEYDGK